MSCVRQRLLPVVALVLLLGGCGGGTEPPREVVAAAGARDQATLTGAGSTLVAPILREFIARYQRVAPAVKIDYRPAGSVEGIRQLESGAVDFAASEVELTDAQESRGGGRAALVQVPWVASGIAIAYNLPAVGELRLTGTTLAAVYTGRIVAWNDPLIRADNPGVTLPPVPITAVHRSDPSGSTRAFAGFLTGTAPEIWALGSGATVRWPRGTAASGSDAMIQAVRQKVGSVGYVGDAYARDASVSTALVRNGAGRFVRPAEETVSAAISGASSESPAAYPITTLSYVAFPAGSVDQSKEAAVRHFVEWVLTDGQRFAAQRAYAPLPHTLLVTTLRKVQLHRDDDASQRRR